MINPGPRWDILIINRRCKSRDTGLQNTESRTHTYLGSQNSASNIMKLLDFLCTNRFPHTPPPPDCDLLYIFALTACVTKCCYLNSLLQELGDLEILQLITRASGRSLRSRRRMSPWRAPAPRLWESSSSTTWSSTIVGVEGGETQKRRSIEIEERACQEAEYPWMAVNCRKK